MFFEAKSTATKLGHCRVIVFYRLKRRQMHMLWITYPQWWMDDYDGILIGGTVFWRATQHAPT